MTSDNVPLSNTWKWKAILTLLSALWAIYLLVPSLFDFHERIEQAETKGEQASLIVRFFPKKIINLGLDLRGGLYLEMDVDIAEALENRVDIVLSQIERFIDSSEFPSLKLSRGDKSTTVEVQLPAHKKKAFGKFLQKDFGDVFEAPEKISISEESVVEGGGRQDSLISFTIDLQDDYASYIQRQTLKQAEEAVRNRIDRYGVVEASIQTQGDDRLIIELPGVKDPERVIDVIRQTGILEFKLVDDSVEQTKLVSLVQEVREQNKIPEGFSKKIVEQLNEAIKGKIPDDDEITFEIARDPVTKTVVNGTPYLVNKRAKVTGVMLRNAQVGIQNNEPFVSLSLNKVGTKNFGEVTKANVGKRLAILLDGTVTAAPVIQEAILTGEARITLGYGSYQTLLRDAEDLALVLREGALPATLTIATKTVIGPTLGLDSIRKGLMSLLIAAACVMLFMIVYYKLGGILATAALVLNVLYIFAILSLFQASLTLPGMAGIVLTLGMAVDANIIIFERMREERRLGKAAKSIVESGYANAMSAIVDANITTLIAGIVLYQFGTGPIKGFATTLIIGIATTLFTAIVVTRLVYDYFIFQRKVKRVVI